MLGVGTDIVSIDKINKLIKSYGDKFINKIFTNNEINYCNSKYRPYIHYSGKFSAKESIKKALISSGYKKFISLKEIEIQNLSDGRPICLLSGKEIEVKLSISHSGGYAQSIACIVK